MGFEREQIGDCTLYRGDCREVLPTLGPVDAVVTDPPYGVGLTVKTKSRVFDSGRSRRASVLYEDNPDIIRCLIRDVMPVLLAQSTRAAVFSGTRLLHDYPQPDSIGAVYAPNGAGADRWGFGCFTPILYYGKCPYLATGRGKYPNSLTYYNPWNPEQVDHPCPKPLKWMVWLVNRASLAGETILDPFMGSGTTGVACVKLGRAFTGIEIEPRYFDLACQRIEETTRQGDLFRPLARSLPQQLALVGG